MKVFTPKELAAGAESKYLGVLVAAKYARELNTMPVDRLPIDREEKLTTRALKALTRNEIEFRLVKRKGRGETD
ncbi:MAG: hypothetical protein J4G12_01335 [Gemmatimonadetes bacterium]|nr:hypothetical protein [Gemmatimonadota bacterium]